MPVPTLITQLDTAAANNSPPGTESARGNIDDYLRAHASFIRQVFNGAQSGSYAWAGTAGGTANALTLTLTPAITAYSAGQRFVFKSGASANSGVTTVAVSGLTPLAAQVNGAACAGGEILADKWYEILVDASLTSCQLNKIGRATLAELGAAALTYVDTQDALKLAKSGDTLTSYRETVVTANSTAAYAMDCNVANVFNLTLTANCTLSFTNIPAGVSFGVTLALKQDATGSRTVTWPAGTRWSGGTAPTLTTTAAKTDFISLFTLDGGTNWNGFIGGKNF